MAICLFAGCENDAVQQVKIDIGEFLDENTIVVPEARVHEIPVCGDHLRLLSAEPFGLHVSLPGS